MTKNYRIPRPTSRVLNLCPMVGLQSCIGGIFYQKDIVINKNWTNFETFPTAINKLRTELLDFYCFMILHLLGYIFGWPFPSRIRKKYDAHI